VRNPALRDRSVVRLERTQRAKVAESLAWAFHRDPMWSFVLPDDETRAASFRPMWRAVIDFAHVYGTVHTTREAEGAACWIAPGKTETTLWKLLRTRFGLPRAMMRLPKDARKRFFAMMRFIDRHHRELMSEPHWYLMALGVAPEKQGQGIGGGLLQPTLDRADADGVSCYLETQTEENVGFYRNRGFEVLCEQREPVGGLPLWFMVRPPGPSAGQEAGQGP